MSMGCASRRAKKSTAPDVLTPPAVKKSAPIGLLVLSPHYPDFFPKGMAAMLRAPDNWEANLSLPSDSPEEPFVFMISYASSKTVAMALGNIAKISQGIDMRTQVVLDHASLIASQEFEVVDQIETYKSGYRIRVELILGSPSGNGNVQSVGYFYILPFPGMPEIIFRAFVFGASEEGYDYVTPFEKSLESLRLVDRDF